ncbi:MAG: hypothetical protein WBC44_13920, partial [Planctomycetaceae bacterium]
MQLTYGNYTHDVGEVTLAVTRSPVTAQNGASVGYTERWDIQGEIIEDDAAALAVKVEALRNAYGVSNRDAIFADSASGAIIHALRVSQTTNGVQAIPPSFPWQDGRALYATGLRYSITLQAEFATTLQSGLTAWTETLAFSGGGPAYVWRQPLRGYPIKQQVATTTPYRLQQSGRAIGRYAYPTPPGPLYPQH